MQVITTANVLAGFDKAIEERGEDFTYQDQYGWGGSGCKYVIGSEAACIVGVILSDLGVPAEVLADLDKGESNDDTGGWRIASEGARNILGNAGYRFEDQEAVAALQRAQGRQDVGHTWGDAVRFAKLEITA